MINKYQADLQKLEEELKNEQLSTKNPQTIAQIEAEIREQVRKEAEAQFEVEMNNMRM